MTGKASIIAEGVIGGGRAAERCGSGWRVTFDYRGVLTTSAQLVERAATIVQNTGARVITLAEVRARLKLAKRAPVAR